MKQKIAVLESLLKEKTNEIRFSLFCLIKRCLYEVYVDFSRLKHDRETMKISDYQKHIGTLQVECNNMRHCLTYVTPPPRLAIPLLFHFHFYKYHFLYFVWQTFLTHIRSWKFLHLLIFSKMRADVLKQQRTVPESNNARKLKETVSFLEKENDMMRSKLRIFFNCSTYSLDGK